MSGWNELDAAVHVLSDPLIRDRCERFVSFQGVEWDDLLSASEHWSHGERLLVLAALDLWNGRAHELDEQFGLRRLVSTLDAVRLERVIEGVRILCGQAVPS